MRRSRIALALAAALAAPAAEAFSLAGGPAAPAVITGAPTATRITGVAPLAVWFDATATRDATLSTTGCSFTNPAVYNQCWAEVSYRWTFGDSGAGTWSTGANAGVASKNVASGPIASHVWEGVGTHEVLLKREDASGNVVYDTIWVTVLDPETYYSGTNTICIGAASDPTPGSDGCPSGADHHQQSAFSTIVSSYLTTGKRVMLKHDDAFTSSSCNAITATGPSSLTMYGTGAKPTITYSAGACGVTKTLLNFGTSGGSSPSDVRIYDLYFDGASLAEGVQAIGGFDQVTILRVDLQNVTYGLLLSPSLGTINTLWDQWAVQDSTIKINGGSGQNGTYLWASHFAYLGNLVDNNATGEHNLRCMYCTPSVVSNNSLEHPAASKGTFVVRAPDWGVANGPLPAHTYNQFIVATSNLYQGGAGVLTPVTTSIDASHDARSRYIIFDGDYYTAQPGLGTALEINSDFTTARNLVMDISAGDGTGAQCLKVLPNNTTVGQPDPTTNFIYNNACYSSDTVTGGTSISGFAPASVSASSYARNTTLANNVLWVPNSSGTANTNPIPACAACTGTVGAAGTFGNSSTTQAHATSPFASSSPAAPADYAAANYASGGGVTVPVLYDFFGNARTGDAGPVAN